MFLTLVIVAVSSLLLGIALTLIIQFYFIRKYFYHQACVPPKEKIISEPFQLPKVLLDSVKVDSLPLKENCVALNLMLQFLFHEMRDTAKVRMWFRKKLSLEFEELLTRTTVGKMFGSIKIREIHLGTQFPIIKSVTVQDVQLNKEHSHINSLDLKLDLKYNGGFQLIIDANMLLGKAAYLSVKVTDLIGEGRLQFNRLPYSHWSFSFYHEPKLQLEVESQFQGRPLPQITALITSQIRKSLKKKHTLPHFKLRYKPFFNKAEEETVNVEGNGSSHMKIVLHSISRLNEALVSPDAEIYCIIALDTVPWVEIIHYGSNSYYLIDLVIIKKSSQPLGLIFKQEMVEDKNQSCVVLDTVTAGSPASDGDAQRGDIIVSVDGKKISTLNHAHKYIKSAAIQFTLRIERRISSRLSYEDFCADRGSLATSESGDTTKSLSILSGLRKRRGSDSDSSGSSPPNSTPGSPSKKPTKTSSPEHKPSLPTLPVPTSSQSNSPIKSRAASVDNTLDEANENCLKLFKSKFLVNKQIIRMEEKLSLPVSNEDQYLNINVRVGTSTKDMSNGKDFLAGYINIPISNISNSVDSLKCYELKPPDTFSASNSRSHKLSSQNGFNPILCYGDMLLTVKHTPRPRISIIKTEITVETPSISTSESTSLNNSRPSSAEKKHDFVRTHFQSSTRCEFCGKKIWLKDAMQCRDCSMTCHKKCITKCQISAACGAPRGATVTNLVDAELEGSPLKTADDSTLPTGDDSTRRASVQPEIIMTSADDAAEKTPQQSARKGLGGLLASVASASRGLKRVGSANNLALPGGGSQGSQQCKSLPPSPQQTPSPSRKASLPMELSEDISSLLQSLMQQGSDQGDMMDFAKATGKTLYEDLDLPERKEKIHEMINKLKAAVDGEAEHRFSLCKEQQATKDPSEKAKTAFLIGKSDEKTQALTVLMLHFFAGLQHIQDLEEQEKEALNETIEIETAVPAEPDDFPK